MIKSGESEKALQLLFTRITRYNFDLQYGDQTDKIISSTPDDLHRLAAEMVQEQAQAILSLLRNAVNGYRTFAGLNTDVKDALDWLIEADDSSPNGLSKSANAALRLAQNAVFNEMVAQLKAGSFTQDVAFDLFRGGLGAATAFSGAITPYLEGLAKCGEGRS